MTNPEFGSNPEQQENKALNPEQQVSEAREFFASKGLKIDAEGLVDPNLSDEQLEDLKRWEEATFTNVLMPTESAFYKSTYLAVSLWRQEEQGKINYLLGKGAGVEVALRGNVSGRQKRPIEFPYRAHSDFEIYAAYNPMTRTEPKPEQLYSPQFKRIFGSQEYFPSTDMKGLTNLPPELQYETAETVELGGIKVRTPQLELMFMDKWLSREATPRPQGYDAELLARQYVLDKELVAKYAEQFVIEPELARAESRLRNETERQFTALEKYLPRTVARLKQEGVEITAESVAEEANKAIERYQSFGRMSRNMSVEGGVQVKYWTHLEPTQVDTEGNLSEDAKAQITQKITEMEQERIDGIKKLKDDLNQFLVSVDQEFAA